DNSASGFTYQLQRNGIDVAGETIAGNDGNISFGNQTAAGNYTVVSIEDATGTPSPMSGSVDINPTPATPTANNDGPSCIGGNVLLSTPAVTSASYSWTGPGGFTSTSRTPTLTNVTAADAGNYSVTVTVGGCTSAPDATTVVVNAAPATPTASNDGPSCVGGNVLLSTPAVTGATYSWTGPGGFTSTSRTPTLTNVTAADAGNYSVTVTVGGCTSAPDATTVVVNPALATPIASNDG